jgi:hypothetical protein
LPSAPRPNASSRVAHAAPTKRLVVDVLTKDIDLVAAIIDLVDNCVDSARLIGGPKLKGLAVSLTFDEKSLTITDNCGGIALDDAVDRAFRFGPDDGDPPDAYSTGQFGIGMKRALFKLGDGFRIRSRAAHDGFTMQVVVKSWLKAPGWDLPLRNVRTGLERPQADRGTTITIAPLRSTIGKELVRMATTNDLTIQIAERHQRSISAGLKISVNGQVLRAKTPEVVCDTSVVPVVEIRELNGALEKISVAIVCGVHPDGPRDAGWSVFLNDRAVLLADKTAATGWGEKDEKRIPGYHPQYSRFRGYAFLTCEKTTRLPWNTTKTGLDGDDAVYREVRGLMLDAADPVIDFLDAVKNEERPDDRSMGVLGQMIREAKTTSVFALADGPAKAWKAPSAIYSAEPPGTTRVYTDRPIDEVDAVKDVAEVSSNKDLGDLLWEYFVRREMP